MRQIATEKCYNQIKEKPVQEKEIKVGLRYRRPSIKIGGIRIHKNKNGYSISSKTITGGRKTYNSGTGKTTITHRTGIKGLSHQTVRGNNKKLP